MYKEVFHIDGMTCNACELRLEKAVGSLSGVSRVKADCKKNTLTVEFDAPATAETIKETVENTGYSVTENKKSNRNVVYILVILLGLYVIAKQCGLTDLFLYFPTVSEERVSYAVLFLIGFLTSVHCVAMCGGINLTQSVAGQTEKPVKKSLLYNLGRLTGYTAVGGVLGLIGEAASVTLQARSIVGIVAGLFMILTGVNMLGNFGFLKRMTPKVPKRIAAKAASFSRHGSFAIGLVNAFMPCGPLQSMQLYAIAGGSFLAGAASMFFFCLGTVPLLFMFGAAAGALKKKWKSVMIKASAVLVLVLGLFMLQNNMTLLGFVIPTVTGEQTAAITATVDGDKQYITTTLHSDGYDNIAVKANIPVVWTVVAEKGTLNGCNNEIVLPAYQLQIKLHEGENIIEFTPTETGVFRYTCWMGMLENTIIVK